MTSRRELLERHVNDYGFDVNDVLSRPINMIKLPSVSIVIPYYETGENFGRCLYFLKRAISKYPSSCEIIVVDDGSTRKPMINYINNQKEIRIIVHKKNLGRTEARNSGLSAANGEIIFFLDSDVLVEEDLIVNHVKLHIEAIRQARKAICVGFFEFSDAKSTKLKQNRLTSQNISINDFRVDCVYDAKWIGCDDDKLYIGQHIRLVDETNNFRSWSGQYKAWMLPNMVLGGVFSLIKDEIDAVGMFDSRFKGYGFTETSAVTKMIAERGNVVIPCLIGGGIHIEDSVVNIPQLEKDQIFKRKHDYYFNTFLEEEI